MSDVVRSLVISFVRSAASGWVRDLGSRGYGRLIVSRPMSARVS